jgi:hypothetical protein
MERTWSFMHIVCIHVDHNDKNGIFFHGITINILRPEKIREKEKRREIEEGVVRNAGL